MTNPLKHLIFAIIALSSVACSPKTTPSTTTNTKKTTPNVPIDYEEDLASVRPHYEEKPAMVVITNDRKPDKEKPIIIRDVPMEVNAKVEAVLDTIANQNKSIKFASGYRIQVYVGNNRQDVDDAKVYVMQNFPELNTYFTYNQPTYKLKAGDFMNRMDAERYFSNIKSNFSGATIISDKIDIRKSLLAK
jgi:hypothetical protein